MYLFYSIGHIYFCPFLKKIKRNAVYEIKKEKKGFFYMTNKHTNGMFINKEKERFVKNERRFKKGISRMVQIR